MTAKGRAGADLLRLSDTEMEPYLRGEKLYGDDFSSRQIEQWFQLEEQAYFQLATGCGDYQYGYHALNQRHGFRWLPAGRVGRALGMGSAYGHEFLPVLQRLDSITIVDPGAFDTTELEGVPIRRVMPQSDGALPFPDGEFDLVTCFGVLHHIPNVSLVVREIFRCLRPGGHALIREPVVSMGDWRSPRAGLTPCERGLPLGIFRQILSQTGFRILRERKCVFPLTGIAIRVTKKRLLNSRSFVALDELLSRLPVWPQRYHARTRWQKIRPSAVYCVLRREPD
jgi:SAM-dependent methyltransferase